MREEYREALRRGRDAVKQAEKAGTNPHLPVLDEMIDQSMIKGEMSLGLMDLPLSMITGNKESARSNAFANNFMPLLDEGSEFALKWENLYESV
ncbi:MAG: BMP family ABC transporter substrate-binding protein, partial [Eubacterium sp.]|nr:BMP family ABC transporter substrate-binding protein [Eubacterium sp.]